LTCTQLIDGGSQELVIFGSGTRYYWYTDFMLAAGMTDCDARLNLRNVVANGQGKPCRQFARVRAENPEDPEVWVDGAYTNVEAFTPFHDTLSVTDMLLVRFGVAFSNSSGSALGSANAGCVYTFKRCGRVFGSANLSLYTNMLTADTGQTLVLELGGWHPAAGLTKLMAGLMVGDNSSTYLETILMLRSAVDPRAPNAWVEVEAAWNNPAAGFSERNTTALNVPAGINLTDNFLVQAGVGLRKKSAAAGNPRAMIQAMCAGIT
jgi:hypothetical protein